ncbi:MAG: lamin tail domain-containing protein [Actinoallomurus sp.]
MKSGHIVGFAATLAAATALLPALPAQAASAVQIYRVYYNSPGVDNRSNTSLNGEWVQIINRASSSRSLTGWRLRDRTGYTYTFGGFRLAARQTVYVHTGKGTDTTRHRYWGRRAYVWNNTGDTAYLRNSSGTLIDTCSWKSSGSSKYC